MDLKNFSAEFEAARAADDFAKMRDIIALANRYCNALASAGRGNEIPPNAIYIAKQVNILIYQIMQLLSDGDAAKAKNYLLMLAKHNVESFDRFFHMLYILAKALYLTGNYSQALKIFTRYEDARAANFGDVDELSLFYRANCLAYLGDFDTANQIYEQILTIKADFPGAKYNLKCNSPKNLQHEIKSLWNFPDWRDIPIFINARDRLGVMKKLIDWLLNAGYRNLIILDNNSTYPPLLEYYSALERDSRASLKL